MSHSRLRFFCVCGTFSPLAPPDPLDPLVVHAPTRRVEERVAMPRDRGLRGPSGAKIPAHHHDILGLLSLPSRLLVLEWTG